MRKQGMSILLVTCAMAVACVALSGCGGAKPADTEGATDQGPAASSESRPAVETAEIEWNGYVMGFDQVSDDPEFAPVGVDIEGKVIKVCFYYVSGVRDGDGFVSETILSDLEEKPIVLKDAEGNTYEYTGSMGDFILKGDFASDGFAMEEFQPRFSITFDVPAGSNIEDFTLDVGNGQEIKLTSYTSDAYAAELAKHSE